LIGVDSGFVIREATRDDAEGILACLREAFEPYRASYTPGAFQDTVLAPKTIGERLAAMTVLNGAAHLMGDTPGGPIPGDTDLTERDPGRDVGGMRHQHDRMTRRDLVQHVLGVFLERQK
jgi:hypothetical protein